MKSKWYEYKDEVLELRKQGVSMTTIHRKYGIPKSTLSGWLKEVKLTEAQRTRLMQNSQDGWKKARESSLKWHKAQKQLRIKKAEQEALEVYKKLPQSDEVLELALAMLYFGEGTKNNSTSIGASDPFMIEFFLASLEILYSIDRNSLRYELHLRDDQDEMKMKSFWSEQLSVNLEQFKYTIKDKRTVGKPTKHGYNGVCQVQVGQIAIQRRLKELYRVYCNSVNTRERSSAG